MKTVLESLYIVAYFCIHIYIIKILTQTTQNHPSIFLVLKAWENVIRKWCKETSPAVMDMAHFKITLQVGKDEDIFMPKSKGRS